MRATSHLVALIVLGIASARPATSLAQESGPPPSADVTKGTWQEAMLATRDDAGRADGFARLFVADNVRGESKPRKITVRVEGVEDLWLGVTDGTARHRGEFAVWGEAVLVAKDGKQTRLSKLRPAAVDVTSDRPRMDKGSRDQPLRIGQRELEHGLWMRSGQIRYHLAKKYDRLEAWIGLESDKEERASIRFEVRTRPKDDPWLVLEKAFPLECDWLLQDLVGIGETITAEPADRAHYPVRWFDQNADPQIERKLIARVLDELGPAAGGLRGELERLDKTPPHARPWLDLYVKACQKRREVRLQAMTARCRRFVFTKHYNMGGSHYAYTEGQSDAQAERHFVPGGALCLCEMNGTQAKVRTLLEDPRGVIRDPDVSYDGRRVLFSWKKSEREDDYHLYTMDLASGEIRQVTSGLGFADYEGAWLPDDHILFNSTRCVQTVDCFTTEVSNLYTCDQDGRFLRRLGFDQVHSNFPTVTPDSRILYTRWEYNDRGQVFPQALFQMSPDGTGQGEFYGNNSWFPTTILHARGIPGTQKVLAVATGHHSRQVGKLIVIDPAKGRQENSGVQLAAPVRETPNVRIDAFGQDGDLFQYPYPLSETEYLVTYAPLGWRNRRDCPCDTGVGDRPPHFALHFMTIDGRRELLVADPAISCNQSVPIDRPRPPVRPNQVDYRKKTGTYYVQDVYAGPGLAGVARGTVKKLRVIALDFRAAVLGGNGNGGPAGGAFISTPVATGNGAWDPKIVLGEADVRPNGSAFFTVPARTPVYFQAIDGEGHMVQSMRSWSTLQPGENGACVGCHESKNSVPMPYRLTTAQSQGPQDLRPFYGSPRGFSFAREVQPILDRHCTRCHDDRSKLPFSVADPGPQTTAKPNPDRSFSLLSAENLDPHAKRRWSDAYLVLTGSFRPRGDEAFRGNPDRPLVNWISAQSIPPMLPPYSVGSAKSGLIKVLAEGHKGAKLSREELDKIACWIDLAVPYGGDYIEANAWSPDEQKRYQHFLEKRRRMEELERSNIEEYLRQHKRTPQSRAL